MPMSGTNGNDNRFLADSDGSEPMRDAEAVQPKFPHGALRDGPQRQEASRDVRCVAETGDCGLSRWAVVIWGFFLSGGRTHRVCARGAGEEDIGAGVWAADVGEVNGRVQRVVRELETDVTGLALEDVGAVDFGVGAESEVRDRLGRVRCVVGGHHESVCVCEVTEEYGRGCQINSG